MTQDERRPIQRPETWDARADNYETTTEYSTGAFGPQLLDALGVGMGTRMLDVAAGAGAVSMAAAERGAVVDAIDFSDGMLGRLRSRAAERGLSIQAQVMDGQSLEFDDDSFDAVCSNFGAIFFPDMTEGLREARRVLKAGAKVAVTGWSQEADGWRALLSDAWRRALPDLPPEMGANRNNEPDVLQGRLLDAGFGDVEVRVIQASVDLPSSQWVLDNFATIQMNIGRMPVEQQEAIREALVRVLDERFPDGKPRVTLEANLATGVK